MVFLRKKFMVSTFSHDVAEIDFNKILGELSKERPLFYNERDFQFSLAWKIKSFYPDLDIRLEKAINVDENSSEYLDIIVLDKGKESIGIELKYITSLLVAQHDEEMFYLKTHSANDTRCYDSLKDIQRLEKFIEDGSISRGYALWLTNAEGLWKGGMNGSNYDEFRIYDGRTVSGNMNWKPGTGDWTKKTRKDPITLSGKYTIKWVNYSDVKPLPEMKTYCKGVFKYSLNEANL